MLDRQKRFEGDLNFIQTEVLQWLMVSDIEEKNSAKRIDWEVIALASNQGTNKALLEKLRSLETEIEERDLEWKTPQTPEEIEEVLRMLGV